MSQKKTSDGIHFIKEFFKNSTNKSMNDLVFYAKEKNLTDVEILFLAKGLSKSGHQINFKNLANICDIPSTGGPSSLSTLLCPLFLRILGNTVLKLGVPGRPAGGIDVLAQISGYNTNPNIDEVKRWIKSSGYVHFEASDRFAPLDAKLFQFRKENNLLNIPSLVIASILSKKLSVGLNYVGLDIRVSKFGNFGKTWDDARQNGRQFNRVANIAGIKSKCFITNGSVPQQSYIGRGESLVAINKIFTNNIDSHLKKHIGQCFFMAYSTASEKNTDIFSINSIKEEFIKNLNIQGASFDSFKQIVNTTEENHKYQILALEEGILSVDLEKIRISIVKIQYQNNGTSYPDPCGVILKAMPNEYICKYDIICTFRCEVKSKEQFERDLKNSFSVMPQIVSSLEFEEIL